MNDHDLKELISRLCRTTPLIAAVTNSVTVNDCANILLAAGASPAMSEEAADAAELTAKAAALYVNIGTVNETTQKAMLAAAETAAANHIPAVLDPAGAGATSRRTETARRLLDTGAFTILRGNLSEILTLAGREVKTRGVDAAVGGMPAEEISAAAEALADRYHLTVGISGAVDLIYGGGRREICRHGHPLMPLVTGSGCMLSALCAAMLAAEPDPVTAASAAFHLMGRSGETAAAALLPGEGNAAFRTRMIDAVFQFRTPEFFPGIKPPQNCK